MEPSAGGRLMDWLGDWSAAISVVGGVSGLLAFAKLAGSAAARWLSERAAERRARADAVLTAHQTQLVEAQTRGEAQRSLVDRVSDLEERVEELTQSLLVEREARMRAEAEREQAVTGRYQALSERDAMELERDAAVLLAARKERDNRALADEMKGVIRDLAQGKLKPHTPVFDSMGTIPPPRPNGR